MRGQKQCVMQVSMILTGAFATGSPFFQLLFYNAEALKKETCDFLLLQRIVCRKIYFSQSVSG